MDFDPFDEDDAYLFDCSDLPCADVGVGIIHHPSCKTQWDDEDVYPPFTPEEEEMLPEDPNADVPSLR